MNRPSRYIPAVEKLTCRCCGLVYYIHAAVVNYIDSGLCVSCENEVRALEAWFEPSGEVRS